MKITVLAPCYRDEQGLDEFHRRVTDVCTAAGYDFQLLLVDDGSPDGTWNKIRALAVGDSRVSGIRLSKNHGHQLAVTAGLAHARGDRVLIIDSDLQDPPELLPEMMRMMDDGANVVYGQRVSRKGVPWWKKWSYFVYYRLLNALAGSEIPPDTGDFRLVDRKVVDLLNTMPEYHRFLRGMVSWIGLTQVALPYHRDARFAGESGYTLAKLFQLAVDGITSFSIKPLRLASLFGFLFAGLCLVGIVYSVIHYAAGSTEVAGWTSLMTVILLVASLQFFVLGMIGEYVGRIFIAQKGRPLFTIAETVGSEVDSARK